MGERKVLNKYIPADFDPKLVPRGTKPKDDLVPVRMMLPFSIQCSTCSSFMYRGRKFNSKKEPMGGPDGKYLGIQRFRFYIKCTVCSRPITFLTDPKNTDYEMESGATRNYEVFRDKEKTDEEIALEKEMEEKADPMKALENRVLDSQREMADLDNLEEIKAMNVRHLKMMSGTGGSRRSGNGSGGFDDSAKAVLMAREAATQQQGEELNEDGLTASEEAMVRSIKFGHGAGSSNDATSPEIRRLDDEDEQRHEKMRERERELLEKQLLETSEMAKAKGTKDQASADRSTLPLIKVKRKRKSTAKEVKKPKSFESTVEKPKPISDGCGSLGGLLGAYGSDSDSE